MDRAEDLFICLYSEWLMDQPEAQITNGDKLIQRIEQDWRVEEFLRQLPDQLAAEIRAHLQSADGPINSVTREMFL